jgi:ribosomal protein S12 methylthiotransferase accessory factor
MRRRDVLKDKLKDDLPESTVRKIKKILSALQLRVTLLSERNPAPNLFSMRLKVDESDMASNGKGTTREYAMASAYAELIERIQTMPIPLVYGLYPPDLVRLKRSEITRHAGLMVETLMSAGSSKLDRVLDLLGKFERNRPSSICCVPFKSMFDGRIEYVPVDVVYMYRTHGMCAGNTREEALTQGICEILERFSNFHFVKVGSTPPDVPVSYIKRYPLLYRMCNALQNKGLHVRVKDCSLDMGVPVAALIVQDIEHGKYYVKFGSHACFEIALERCFTEAMQGREISDLYDHMSGHVHPFEYTSSNMESIFSNGRGAYPESFFMQGSSRSFYPWWEENDFQSNEETLEYLMSALRAMGRDVCVRDTSFFGFPTYHVVIPGFSEVICVHRDLEQQLRSYVVEERITRGIREKHVDWASISREIDVMVAQHNLKGSLEPLSERLQLPWIFNQPDGDVPIEMVRICIAYKLGRLDRAIKLCDGLQTKKLDADKQTDYRCLANVLSLLKQKVKRKRILKDLSLFYGEERVESTLEYLEKSIGLKELQKRMCFDCARCGYENTCVYKRVNTLFSKVKPRGSAHEKDSL